FDLQTPLDHEDLPSFPTRRSSDLEIIKGAIEQYREICRLDPSDSESALWLARLYRLQNSHQKAEEVLRGVLKTDPQNQQAIEQLDRKSTRLNSSHVAISYAVFCLK